jgi:hypothetical protein
MNSKAFCTYELLNFLVNLVILSWVWSLRHILNSTDVLDLLRKENCYISRLRDLLLSLAGRLSRKQIIRKGQTCTRATGAYFAWQEYPQFCSCDFLPRNKCRRILITYSLEYNESCLRINCIGCLDVHGRSNQVGSELRRGW